jgi:hypothetical protein
MIRACLFDLTFWPRRVRYALPKAYYLATHGWTIRYAASHFVGYIIGRDSI